MRGLRRGLLLALAALVAVAASGDPAPRPLPPTGQQAVGQAGDDIEDFVPSQKVKADDAVSFPTDI